MIVKARLWKGKIAAQIPFELKNEVTCRRTIMGYKFVKAEKPYWEMPYSPFTAMMLNNFEQVEYMDQEIPALYQSYLKALEAKVSTDLPPHLPGIKHINPKDGTELKPWLHQRQAYWFCKDLPGSMLAFDMGCISGDAIISVNRAGITRQITLETLYKRFHSLDKPRRPRRSDIKWTCRALKGDRFGLHEIQDVLDKGVRSVIKLKLDCGKEITCTPDHEIAQLDGEWVRADSLKAGDIVLTNGRKMKPNYKCVDCGVGVYRPPSSIRKLKGSFEPRCLECVLKHRRTLTGEKNHLYNGGRFIDKDGYIRVHRPGHHRANASGHVYEHIVIMEKELGRSVMVGEIVHHVNGIKDDNRPENLRLFEHQMDHSRVHDPYKNLDGGRTINGGKVFVIPKESVVVSIEEAGEQNVYDVVMADPHRNFVANGVVVHNCGKSLSAVALTVNAKHDRVIIVCPKSVIPVWPQEFKYAIDDSFMFYAAEGRKSVEAKSKQLKTLADSADRNRQPFVFIVNYDAFWREEMKKVLLNYDWDVMIADENHRAKNPGNSARASRFLTRLARQCKKRIGLTGTPMPHAPLDIFAQYRALDPAIYGENYHRFKMLYAEMGGFGGKQVMGYKNMDELSAKFKSIAIQASKDVLDLPEFVHDYRSCELCPKAKKIYQSLNKQLFAEIEEGTCSPANAMVKVLRLQQLTSGYIALDNTERLAEVDTGKRDLLKDVLEDLPQDEPVVVFCRFTADIRNVRKVADDLKRPVSELSGKRNDLKAWQDGKTTVLAVQIRSGGVGIDLTRAAYCIYYSVGHSLGDYLQSLDRTHRYGQKRNVTYYHLLAEDTIDGKVYKALMLKKDIIDSILNREV